MSIKRPRRHLGFGADIRDVHPCVAVLGKRVTGRRQEASRGLGLCGGIEIAVEHLLPHLRPEGFFLASGEEVWQHLDNGGK